VPVPRELVGAWRRSGLIIDGSRQVDYCDVLWLQSADWYADIRLALPVPGPVPTDGVPGHFAKERAFAGITTWTPPVITWEHVFDVRENPPLDSKALRWHHGVVVERGTQLWNGRDVPWEEEWLRMSDDDVEPVVTLDDRCVHIAVGDWVIETKDERPKKPFRCTRYDRIHSGWREVGTVGS
jgi:hypothetical protein